MEGKREEQKTEKIRQDKTRQERGQKNTEEEIETGGLDKGKCTQEIKY